MMGIIRPLHRLVDHHEDLLIVKLRESSAAPAHAIGTGGRDSRARGLMALAAHDHGGRVKRIAHLYPSDADPVRFRRNGAMAMVAAVASQAKPRHRHHGTIMIELEPGSGSDELRQALLDDPHIEYAAPVPVRYLFARVTASPHAPLITSALPPLRQWNLDRIGWPLARARMGFVDADSIRVAVLDSGVDDRHPALKGRISSYHHDGADHAALSAGDIVGHGTHVAGVLVASPVGAMGAQGICTCDLSVWKTFEDQPTFDAHHQVFIYTADPILYRRALSECHDLKMDVVSVSMGGPAEPDPHERTLYDALLARGTTVVVSMGNAREIGSPRLYPAALPGIIAVGATDPNDVVGSFSSAGDYLSLCAPGVAIWSTLPLDEGQFGFEATTGADGAATAAAPFLRNREYDAWPGTSTAAPHVAGAVALLLANHGRMSPADVRQRLMATADVVPAMGGARFSIDYGAGRLNLQRLLAD